MRTPIDPILAIDHLFIFLLTLVYIWKLMLPETYLVSAPGTRMSSSPAATAYVED